MKCECGATATNQPGHSYYCPMISVNYWDLFMEQTEQSFYITRDREKLQFMNDNSMWGIPIRAVCTPEDALTLVNFGTIPKFIFIEKVVDNYQTLFHTFKSELPESFIYYF